MKAMESSSGPAPRTHEVTHRHCRSIPASITMIGPFPPPLHGASAVNAAVRDSLLNRPIQLRWFNLSPFGASRSLVSRVSRLPRIFIGLTRLAWQWPRLGQSLYMSLSGGPGLLYETAFLCLARLQRRQVTLHHHSYAYLDRSNRLAACLFRLAGPSATHVVLSPLMAGRLQSTYAVQSIRIVSNAIFLPRPAEPEALPIRSQLTTLGFLSNISVDKGIDDFLDLIAEIRRRGVRIQATLAGPFRDDRTARRVGARLASLPEVEYIGALYGLEKTNFLKAIDVLIFPSRSLDEAEPLTIHEALRSAVPVIAYGRGAIPEIVEPEAGLILDPTEPFVPAAAARIEHWIAEPAAFKAASCRAAAAFRTHYEAAVRHWQAFLQSLSPVSASSDQADRESLSEQH